MAFNNSFGLFFYLSQEEKILSLNAACGYNHLCSVSVFLFSSLKNIPTFPF